MIDGDPNYNGDWSRLFTLLDFNIALVLLAPADFISSCGIVTELLLHQTKRWRRLFLLFLGLTSLRLYIIITVIIISSSLHQRLQ